MKIKIYALLFFIFFLGACSNNEVSDTYKEEQYSIIKGLNFSQEGKYSIAIGEYFKAYKINSSNPFTLRELALNYGKSGDLVNSEKFYKELLAVLPNDPSTLYNLGILYYNQQRFQDSLNILSKIGIENLTADTKSLEAFDYYRLGKVDEAYKRLQLLQEAKKDDIEFSKIYIEILMKIGKLGELHPYISKVYANNLNNPEIVYLYANHLNNNLGKYKEAIEVYETYTINYGIQKEILLDAAKLSLENYNYDASKKYLNLVPEKFKYEKVYLNLALQTYKGLNDVNKIKEIESIIKKNEKE